MVDDVLGEYLLGVSWIVLYAIYAIDAVDMMITPSREDRGSTKIKVVLVRFESRL